MNCYILLVNFVSIFLKFVDWKKSLIVNISLSDSDIFLSLINISQHMRHTYFVFGIFWENFTNEWLQMVFTDRPNETIVCWNMVEELAWVSVNVTQENCIHTFRYVKQGVGIRTLNGARFSSDHPNNVQSCLQKT